MAAIRSRDTKPELAVRRAVHHAGFRYRVHNRGVPGRPDLVLARYRTVIFVHGCFWHGHSCDDGHVPRTNTAYWRPKIAGNVARDARNTAELLADGWRVYVVRDCTIDHDVRRVIANLRARRRRLTAPSPSA